MRRALLAFGVLLTGPSLLHAEEPKPARVLFEGATVLDGKGGKPAAKNVLIADGKIARIGAKAADPKARRIRVKGAFLTPGLIDPACRDGYAGDQAERTRELTAHARALDLVDPRHREFRDAAREGCTTVLVVPGGANVVGGEPQAFHTMSPKGRAVPIASAKALQITLAGEATSGNFPPRSRATTSIYARRPNTRMGTVWLLRQTFLAAKGQQPLPGKADLGPYKEVLAGKRTLRVLAHRFQDIEALLRIAGEVGFTVQIEAAEEAYMARRKLAQKKVPVIVGPFPNETTGAGPDYTDTALRNVALLRKAGVKVALSAGTAGPRWLREQAIFNTRYGLSREDALAAVTSVAAELAGLKDRGRIEQGLAADVVLWSGHPLLPTSRALVVVAGGHVVIDETRKP